ncbi:CCA tRNA nucleotidyltransferase [Tropicimonas sp. IMCC34043]|uniref:CCA tRNA nucleotidyltransferase n=1 Tax=Tropicimonas sp. IMCC34043 TaxID=2248760 RepID=UPI000E233173|nr:CCA tRNA nucleotidyltransferase [Tropicimonas sp. IMCC34043]
MTRLSASWLDAPAVQRVCGLLEAAGFRALFVGGCVRNTLLGQPVSDHDLSTDARPERVTEVMQAAGLKVVPTGIEHGTVTVLVGREPFEITTFRRDVETDGRRAVVHFSDRVEEDARRRDFTMNAIYCDRLGLIVDPLNGMPDLQARRLRFVGTAVNRVREDYLRILRFFRFSAWYADPADGIDPEALAACAANVEGLHQISAERIGAEVLKLLAAPDPAPAVAVMQTAGVLAAILPGADVSPLTVLVHLEQMTGTASDPIMRLAALGGEAAPQRLRLSRTEARRLDTLAEAARSDRGAGELGFRLGAVDGRAAVLVRAALIGVAVPPEALAEVALGANAHFPVAAHDLMPGLQGAALGARMRALEQRWIASGFALSRAELLA